MHACRQYKQRQDDLCDEINVLENERIELIDRLDLRRIDEEQIKKDLDEEIARQVSFMPLFVSWIHLYIPLLL